MKPKIKLFKNGAYATMGKLHISGMYLVECKAPNGETIDKIRCDDYGQALTYYRAFSNVAKNR